MLVLVFIILTGKTIKRLINHSIIIFYCVMVWVVVHVFQNLYRVCRDYHGLIMVAIFFRYDYEG